MPIPENQLVTWSAPGAGVGSRDTYATIKGALERGTYQSRDFEIFLQGSYGNDTNVYAESDVDVVIRSEAVFSYELLALSANERAAFQSTYPSGAPQYDYSAFRDEVLAALRATFGNAVQPGPKAISVAANGNRRKADVLVAIEFRYYRTFPAAGLAWHTPDGLCFFTPDWVRIVNYPKTHSANCTAKHQATNGWFKPTVRILKNVRNRLVQDGLLNKETAPSYFIEGLLYNVPNDKFGASYHATILNSLNWVSTQDRSQFLCANGLYSLLGDQPWQWSSLDCDVFLDQMAALWNNWS